MLFRNNKFHRKGFGYNERHRKQALTGQTGVYHMSIYRDVRILQKRVQELVELHQPREHRTLTEALAEIEARLDRLETRQDPRLYFSEDPTDAELEAHPRF